jgi:uridine phosphorylase
METCPTGRALVGWLAIAAIFLNSRCKDENWLMPEERFTPQMHLDYALAQRGITIEDIGIAPVVVVAWGQEVIQALADAVEAQGNPHWFPHPRYQLYNGTLEGRRVSFVHVPVGAPNTVLATELMIACGARLLLGLGWAGSLQPRAPVGTLLIPARCVREEGTSFHYVDDGVDVVPSARLVQLLEAAAQAQETQAVVGPHWTTDAPFRELRSKIAAYGQQGVVGVDMETSAMYALGLFRGVEVCNLLVVSDELWQDWNPGWHAPQLETGMASAQHVILRVLANDALLRQ